MFLLFILVIFISVIIFLRTPMGKGWLGEFKVKIILGKNVAGQHYVLNNVKFRIDEFKTCQIDHIVINKNGVFVIETKNLSGIIYGEENAMEWMQNLGRQRYAIYNPVRQNRTHTYYVSNCIDKDIPLTSAVVFVKANIDYVHSNDVYTLIELKQLISRDTGANLTPIQIQKAYNDIVCVNDKTISTFEHVNNIYNMQYNLYNNICPRYGKPLILKYGKHGEFMGCSGYPECKFTKKLY